jgi:hypothetical protein
MDVWVVVLIVVYNDAKGLVSNAKTHSKIKILR